MAATTAQPIGSRSQLDDRVSSIEPPNSLTRVIQSQTLDGPVPDLGRGAEEIDNTTQPPRSSAVSGHQPSWSQTLRKVVNICSVLGVILTLIIGIYAWVAQDKSIAIAKESELVTLALSCSDEKIKDTPICQQFLDKYPDGPTISRRGGISVGSFHHEDPEVWQSAHMDLQYTAVYLALMSQLLQEQSSRFHSALDNPDPKQSMAQMGDIHEAGKEFVQNMTLIKAALTAQRVEAASYIPSTSPFMRIFEWVAAITLWFFMPCLLFFNVSMEFIYRSKSGGENCVRAFEQSTLLLLEEVTSINEKKKSWKAVWEARGAASR
ncbi:hypothetical protein F5B22DRAFT_595724, partial [Xylaria bambusicola]|uniref:uncharacterized protein n=1 Tax=Xylaria bambusicola TaxID=326684 RepID=UPI002007E2D5